MSKPDTTIINLRESAIFASMRTREEIAQDEKYDIHAAGDCDWESCEWCIAAQLEAEESLGG